MARMRDKLARFELARPCKNVLANMSRAMVNPIQIGASLSERNLSKALNSKGVRFPLKTERKCVPTTYLRS